MQSTMSISHAQRRTEAKSVAVEIVEHLCDKTAALRGEPYKPGKSFSMERRRIEFQVWIGNAEAVRSEETDSVFKCDCLKLFLHPGSFSAGFLEPAGYDNGMLDAFPAALSHCPADDVGRQDYNGQVRYFGQIHNAGIGPETAHLFFRRVDRVDGSFKTKGLH
jgi:hypothetical protein